MIAYILEPHVVDSVAADSVVDLDIDLPLSPRSPNNVEKQKNDMEKFVIW